MACGNGHVEILKKISDLFKDDLLLLKRGIDHQNQSGNTPIHWAVLCNQIEAVEAMIQLKADCGTRNQDKQTPLDLALITEDEKLIELISKNSKISKEELTEMEEVANEKDDLKVVEDDEEGKEEEEGDRE